MGDTKVEKKQREPKPPRELKTPATQADIDINFINRYFSYQVSLARYNYKTNETDENKRALENAKAQHTEWLNYVEGTYNGKVSDAKTKKIIKKFIELYYPDLPKKPEKVLGLFK